MGHRNLLVLAFLLVVGQHCVHNLFPNLIEETLRIYRRRYMNTDEGHYLKRPFLQEYDFIVVGAGPGGSVVANRLSENPDWKVLLLEAGREDTIIADIPIFVSYMTFTDYNWGQRAEPQSSACLGLTDGQCRWPRGKGLGGTSLINYMIYTRGNRADYNLWAEQGNPGWSYDEVLPYFLKSEDIRIPELQDSPHHKQNGYLPVEHIAYRTKLGDAFLEAGKEMGYNIIDYNNGEIPSGFAPVQEMMNRGHRASSAKAFLKPIRNRENLHIAVKSRVTKVLIDPASKTAYGVEVVRDRKTYTIRARKEVVLSAGSMASPQLLMLSGVGPRSHLEELGIPVIQDLPGVGQNINEHVSYCGLTFLTNETYTGIVENRMFNVNLLAEFMENGTGPFALPGGVEALAYINTKLNDDKRGRPDIELIFASGSLTSDGGRTVREGIGVTDQIYEETFRPVDHRDSWTVWPMILHPKSRGYLRLKSKNPWNWPKFYANYFENEHDLETIVEGIKFTIEMSKTKAFQKYGSYLNSLPLKPCVGPDSPQNSDNYWRCAVRHLTTTLHHQSGTCKMGPPTDPDAVVSNELKVYGIQNLRVIDASIIPQLVTAHTTAPTFMIGEKGSDMINSTWANQPSYPSYPSQPNPSYPSQPIPNPSYPSQTNPNPSYPSQPTPSYPSQPTPNPPNQPIPNPSYPSQPIPNPSYPAQPTPPQPKPTSPNQPSYPTNPPKPSYPNNQPSNPKPPSNFNYPNNQENIIPNNPNQPNQVTDFNYPTNNPQPIKPTNPHNPSNPIQPTYQPQPVNPSYPYPVGSGNQNPVTNVIIPGSGMPIPVPVPMPVDNRFNSINAYQPVNNNLYYG